MKSNKYNVIIVNIFKNRANFAPVVQSNLQAIFVKFAIFLMTNTKINKFFIATNAMSAGWAGKKTHFTATHVNAVSISA